MTDIRLVGADMRGAADAVRSAAGSLNGGSGPAIGDAAAAMPGSTCAGLLPGMGTEWDDGVRSWRDAADEFGQTIEEHADGMSALDASVAFGLGWG